LSTAGDGVATRFIAVKTIVALESDGVEFTARPGSTARKGKKK
jgi:hypothetical protein